MLGRHRRRYMGDYTIGLGRHRRRRHRRGMRGFFGLGDPGFTDDLKDVAIGLAGGVGGILLGQYAGDKLPVSAGVRTAIKGVVGVVGGALLTRANRPLGIGLGAGMGGSALADAVSMATAAAPAAAANGLDAYTWSRRYGRSQGIGYRDPYSFSAAPKPTYYGWGLGRTRVVDQDAGGREFSAYTYSRRRGRSE